MTIANLYTTLLDHEHELRVQVGDTSHLVLDAELDSHYLINAVLIDLPAVQGILAKILTLDLPVFARQGSTALLARTSTMIGVQQSNISAMQEDFQVAFQNTHASALQTNLSPALEESVATTTEFINTVGRIWNAPGGD